MFKETLESLMKAEGLTPETILYRYTNAHHIVRNNNGETIVKANPNSQEMVVNHYENGHLTAAEEIGQGLAFALSKDSLFKSSERKCISILLGDILAQGGTIYKDVSSGEPNSWFLTMPNGETKITEV